MSGSLWTLFPSSRLLFLPDSLVCEYENVAIFTVFRETYLIILFISFHWKFVIASNSFSGDLRAGLGRVPVRSQLCCTVGALQRLGHQLMGMPESICASFR